MHIKKIKTPIRKVKTPLKELKTLIQKIKTPVEVFKNGLPFAFLIQLNYKDYKPLG